MDTTQLLHLIRASAGRLRRETRSANGNTDTLEHALGSLLVNALLTRSATDVAVILGSAAELQWYPDDALLNWAKEVLGQDNLHCRGVYWAVRHRCSRTGKPANRFAAPACRERHDGSVCPPQVPVAA